ncbi:MAG TPA: MaoC family dehydratase [Alphaproteobacteria bacterium]|nr:MaoC family dehydratase [Alphaproteobacteria bacterium]
MAERYFEDFKPGDRVETSGLTLTESHMIAFALSYDPQPFHIDREAAKSSIYGGLIGSGFLTMAVTFRLLLQSGMLGSANLGGIGFDEVRFLKPVRPGDTLCATVEVVDSRPSQSKADRGVLRLHYRTYNQHGEEVMNFLCPHLIRRRPA